MNLDYQSILQPFLSQDHQVNFFEKIPSHPISKTEEIEANSFYFSHSEWAKTYFEACHRDNLFRERWLAAAGSWDNKIVVEVGCGPGNLFANLGGNPKLLIGIDVAPGSLEMAQKLGYVPLLADAHNLPLISGFADIVAVNATLHHCQDMEKVLTECARLVRSGGVLVIDHDPQLSAWNYKGLGLLLYKMRLGIIYRFLLRDLYVPDEERMKALATEVHHKPGHGVTAALFRETLEPLGFAVALYPHNNAIGAKALKGDCGDPPHWRYRVGQLLSGTQLGKLPK
ncbi:methylase involved in ubiquinone/menaquinone biosynthesis [Leptolyngbyaceae cyanobacterium JSC-12]|nr:methylase involved in ubiquinone/menaquinone biosynthesis [Leptolyngbyaceae cyanobacterium JSC-12]